MKKLWRLLTLRLLVILHAFLSSADLYQNQHFRKKIFQECHQRECQTVWTHIRPDILSGLMWVQTVCECYQAEDDISRQRVTTTRKYLLIDCRVAPSESVISLKKKQDFIQSIIKLGSTAPNWLVCYPICTLIT